MRTGRPHEIFINKEKLDLLYWEKALNCKQIGSIYGCSWSSIRNLMKRYKIPCRIAGRYPRREILKRLYWVDNLMMTDIAKIFCVDSSTVCNWFKRYKLPTRHKFDYFECTKKHSEKMKGKRFSDEHKMKISEAVKRFIKKHGYWPTLKSPTKPEKKIIRIIKEHNLPFEYVGDGKVTIWGLNPDFIECNGEKIIIEVFSRFWHEKYKNIYWKRTEWGRKAIFGQLGYKTLILWDDDIKKMSDTEIVDKIKGFIK